MFLGIWSRIISSSQTAGLGRKGERWVDSSSAGSSRVIHRLKAISLIGLWLYLKEELSEEIGCEVAVQQRHNVAEQCNIAVSKFCKRADVFLLI